MLQINQALDDQDLADHLSRILAEFSAVEAPLLEILHRVQEEFGYVPEQAKRAIADALNLSRAEVHGVVTFYHDFRPEPRGRHTLKLCRAEACQSMGGEAIAKQAAEMLGIPFGETTPDGAVSLDAVYCLGLCACAPSAMLDDSPTGRMTSEKLKTLITEARR